MKLIPLLTCAAVALSAPSLIDGTGVPQLDEAGSAYAKNGNGNGNGNGGGNGRGNGNGGGNGASKADKSAKTQGRAKSTERRGGQSARASGKRVQNRLNKTLTKLGLTKQPRRAQSNTTRVTKVRSAPKVARTTRVSKAATQAAPAVAKRPSAAPKERNLHAQLKGLNSLNRNANGFFNGNDPKLDPFRAFVAASVEGAAIEDALNVAQEDVAAQQVVVDALLAGLEIAPTEELSTRDALDDARADLLASEPDLDAETRADWEQELASLDEALGALDRLDTLEGTLEETQVAADESGEAVSPEALREAIAASYNTQGNRSVAPEEISDEVVEFVSDKLGIGEADGFIDVALERAAEEEEIADAGEDPLDPETIVTDPEAETEIDPLLIADET